MASGDVTPGGGEDQTLGLCRQDLERDGAGAVSGSRPARLALAAHAAIYLAVDGDDAYVLKNRPGEGIRLARIPFADLDGEDHVDAVAGIDQAGLAGRPIDQDGDGAVVGLEGGGKEAVLAGPHDRRPGQRRALEHRPAHYRSNHIVRPWSYL